MKRLIILIFSLCSYVINAQQAKSPFVHPGLTHTLEDLERIKSNVQAGNAPWIDGWNKLCKESDAGPEYKPSAGSTVGGSDGTRQRAYRDAQAAYYNFLRWYVTGNIDHAECAVNIINAWANSIQSPVTGQLFMLSVEPFIRVAELLQLYPGWKDSDIERFKFVAREYFYPPCRDFRNEFGSWPGWDAPANSDCLYIGILLDDEDMVNDAIDYYKNGKGGGCVTNGIVFGRQPIEMGRDQPHVNIGLDAYAEFCQVLWNQGIDMFSYEDNLLLKGFEYFSQFNLNNDVEWEPIKHGDHIFYYPAPSSNAPLSLPNNRITGNELIYHHYVDRMGLEATYLRAMLKLKDCDILTGTLYTVSDTTTVYIKHKLPSSPSSLKAEGSIGRINLTWVAPENFVANGFDIQRSLSPESGFVKIAGWTNNVTCEYVDKDVTPGVKYYYRVCAKNQSGNSEWTEIICSECISGSINFSDGWTMQDISLESDMKAGNTKYHELNNNTYLITGTGTDIYNPSQAEGNFTYTSVTGDFEFTTRIFDGEQIAGQIKEKFGLMLRESINATSAKIVFWIGDTGTRFNHFIWRNTKIGNGSITGSDHTWIPLWLKLKRKGNIFEAFVSDNGKSWHIVGSQEIPFSDTCLAGLWVCGGGYRPNGYTIGFDNVSLISNTPVPTIPANFKATVLNSTQISLGWTKSQGMSSFDIKRSLSENGNFKPIAKNLAGTSFYDEDLEPETTYFYSIRSANAAGFSKDSVVISATTSDLKLPSAPTGIKISSKNERVTLSWNKVLEKTEKYVIKRRPALSSTSDDFEIIGETDYIYYDDVTVENDSAYYYKVAAVNVLGEGQNSFSLKATPTLGSSIYLSFNENSGLYTTNIWRPTQRFSLINSEWRTGKYDKGILLKGSENAYVSLPPGIVSSFTDITISCWVKMVTNERWMRLFDFGTGESNYIFLTTKNGDGNTAVTIKTVSGEESIKGPAISLNTWVHVAVTIRDEVGILYINGNEVGRNETLTLKPTDLGVTTQNYIGRSQYNADPYLDAYIDEFRIYSQALTGNQIKQLKIAKANRIYMDKSFEIGIDIESYNPAIASSGLPVTYKSNNSSIAYISNNVIELRDMGVVDITASQIGNINYVAATPVTQALTINIANTLTDINASIDANIFMTDSSIEIHFNKDIPNKGKIELYTIAGVMISSINISNENNIYTIDLPHSANDIYILKFIMQEKSKSYKIIREKNIL